MSDIEVAPGQENLRIKNAVHNGALFARVLLAVLDMPDNIDPRESPRDVVLSFKAGYNAALSDVRKKIWKA